MNEPQSNPYVIPFSILISGVLIAGAIMYAGGGGSSRSTAQVGSAVGGAEEQISPPGENGDRVVRPVDTNDHILGDPSAPVKIVEYSDLECPFCSGFHTTMKQLIDEFGKNGQVAWVYRHFPLESIHPSARMAANGAECAGELGGEEMFWEFIDSVFEQQNSGLSETVLIQIANDLTLDRAAFSSCLTSGKYNNKIDEDTTNALESGGRGTPYSVIIAADGSKSPINGAVPYATLKAQVEAVLNK
jgi:protein-disulfide isomerase